MKLIASVLLILKLTIPLPNVKGRFDHFAVDVKGGRIFVAALGNNTVEVIDAKAGKALRSITGLSKPQGLLYLPERNQLFVANGGDSTVNIFDAVNYKLLRSIGSLSDADNIRYDEKAKLVYVGFGDGALAIIDPAKQEKIGEIKLKGHPESFQLEKNGNRIFVNVPAAKQVAVIDRDKRQVITEWHWEKVEANFPMTLDEANHRLIVGCRKPTWLLIADTKDGKFVKVHSISSDVDDLFYDTQRKRIYASCGDGFIDVIEQKSADDYATLEKIPTQRGARTSLLVPEWNRFCVAVPAVNNATAEIRIYELAK